MIKLGYIDGYNSYNEIKFNSANDRDAHFNGWVDYTIDAYYPPYYTNVIKLDKSEVPQTAPINFVILVHNSKWYYYFVDHINYVNEDIYEIVINMDTIMTYQFDFKINQGLVTRKSIPRWIVENTNVKINRNYVRENVSEGIMEVNSLTYRNPNKYIIITSSYKWADQSSLPGYYIDNDSGAKYHFGYYTYVAPLPPFELSNLATIEVYNNNTRIDTVYYENTVNRFIDDPFTINMMIVESEYLDKILHTDWSVITQYSRARLDINYDNITSLEFIRSGTFHYCCFNLNHIYLNSNNVFNISLGFTRNTLGLVNFNPNFIPQLIDENYMQIEYGDINGFASYPMHQLYSPLVKCYNNLDITNGNSGYYIEGLYDDKYNKHKTYTVSLGLTFDLITDPWKEYQAQNKGTLSTGLQLQAVNTLYSTAKSVIPMASGVSFTNTNRLYQNLEKNTESFTNKQTTSFNKGSMTGISDGLMQGINIVANYQINRDNLEFSPDTVKGRGDVYTMLFSKYKIPYFKIHKVSDIENCARKLEEFGYRVNEIFTGNSYIQDICNIRTYYNCISMRVKLYTTSCLIPNDMINDILARLENGLRFIDIHSVPSDMTMIDIFKYDNVER